MSKKKTVKVVKTNEPEPQDSFLYGWDLEDALADTILAKFEDSKDEDENIDSAFHGALVSSFLRISGVHGRDEVLKYLSTLDIEEEAAPAGTVLN